MSDLLMCRRSSRSWLWAGGRYSNEEGTPSTLSSSGNQATRPVARPSNPERGPPCRSSSHVGRDSSFAPLITNRN